MSKYYFRGSSIFGFFIQKTRTSSSLAHIKDQFSKVPVQKENNIEIKIDKFTITKLEKLSLVEFDNERGIRKLESAIRFAQKLRDLQLDDHIQPMYSVLENEKLELREDKVSEGNCQDKILKNAKIIEDEYFIAPPDNVTKNC
jgi:aspartyl/glutamyl-tRNA(Asn/Gln) amidotransferase C subunit